MTTVDPTRQVFVLHNQSCADAAAELLAAQTVCAIDVDWGDLQGCRLVLWPANTALSKAAMRTNARLALEAGAASVRLFTPGPLEAPGWDAAEALRMGWDKADTVAWLRAGLEEVTAPDAKQQPEPGAAPPPPARNRVSPAAEQHASERPALDGPLEDQWAMLGLEVTKSGPSANEDTVMRVLERHPGYHRIVWYDEFLGRIMTPDGTGAREWGDADIGRLTVALQRDLGLTRIKVHHVKTAIMAYAYANLTNCAQDWLRSLKWDGTERIAAFFSDYCGADDTPYTRAVGRNFFLSMVARVLRPGCKVDNMVILEGGQGTGKSSMLKALGGDWYTVQHEAVTGKGFFEVLQGKMLVEIAEMDAFGKAEVTRVKQVVSTETDRYRAAYGHYAQDHKRHSIFAGTTNVDDWNRDPTGARRFWPIRVSHEIDIPAILKARGQLFAEAVAAYDRGDFWWVMPEAETRQEQDERREEDPWTAPVADWLADIYRAEVTIEQVLGTALELRRVDHTKANQMRVASILRGLKWTKENTGGRRFWARPEKTT